MADEEMHDKEALRSNAVVVVDALKSINGPATLQNVVHYLAARHELNASKIKEPVQDILTNGYNLGFLEMKGGKYMIRPNEDLE